MTKGWYIGVGYQVSNVTGSLISFCFSHLIGGLLAGTDHFCREGKEKDDVVFLAVRDSGKRDQIYTVGTRA